MTINQAENSAEHEIYSTNGIDTCPKCNSEEDLYTFDRTEEPFGAYAKCQACDLEFEVASELYVCACGVSGNENSIITHAIEVGICEGCLGDGESINPDRACGSCGGSGKPPASDDGNPLEYVYLSIKVRIRKIEGNTQSREFIANEIAKHYQRRIGCVCVGPVLVGTLGPASASYGLYGGSIISVEPAKIPPHIKTTKELLSGN